MQAEERGICMSRAILCGVHTGTGDILNDTTDESMEELSLLCESAGGEVVAVMVQNREKPESRAYFGEGKLDELRGAVLALDADLIIFDDELTGIQIRNIEEETACRTIDRSMLILDIFALRARSKEGKL